MGSLQDYTAERIDGAGDLVPALRGKVVLAVNVASRCGLTPQYAGLEKLYGELKNQGFVIVGFPCNQFGAQEPGTEPEIVSFCQSRYAVTFPLTRKVEVNGPGRHPIYQWLTSVFPGDIEWNFGKFLIGRDGKALRRYPPQTAPDDKGLLQDIADALEPGTAP